MYCCSTCAANSAKVDFCNVYTGAEGETAIYQFKHSNSLNFSVVFFLKLFPERKTDILRKQNSVGSVLICFSVFFN